MIVLAATAQVAEEYTTIPQALVNTVIAMGTVFLVLILISFIIYLFKFIPVLMDKLTKKEEPVQPAAQAQPAPAPKPAAVQTPAAPADDTQLIAVITAAVAAAMEEDGVSVPADGLVIRSIKKRSY